MLASAILAWWHIRSVSIWYDEAITMLTVSGHTIPDSPLTMQLFHPSANLLKILSDLYHYDVHPPLYFWILAIWRVIFGGSLEVARALSTLFTLATLALLYRYAIAVELRWPSVPVVLYAFSAAGLRYAYNARPYAMATFLIVLTLYLAHRKSPWTGLCAAVCVATHYFAALCVGPIVVIECLLAWNLSRRWALATFFSFAALCAPLAILVANHVGARPHQYPGFGIFRKELHELLRAAIKGAMPSSSLWRYWYLAIVLAGLFALVGGLRAIARKQFTLPLACAAFLSSFLLLAVVTNKSIMQMPNDYYLGVGAPLLVLLMAYGVNAVPYATPLLAAAVLVGTITQTPTPMFTSPDYRAMMAHIRSECDHCSILVGFGWGGSVPACVLYESHGLDVYSLKWRDTPDEVLQRIGPNRIIYLIPANEPRTIEIEKQFEQSFLSEPGDGYYKLDVSHPLPH
jgi:4-amino-4-deoxy-L-arabinose transferase-like glycosyltransferase